MSRGTMETVKLVRPLLSIDKSEAHRRVLGLYRAFYRYIPYIVKYYDIPKNEEDVRTKIREHFYANAYIQDLRVIDLLVLKGWMEFNEVNQQWQQKGFIYSHWSPTREPKPTTFIGKFLEGRH